MENKIRNDPAGRLMDILISLKEQPSNISGAMALARTLSIPENENGRILTTFAKTALLVEQAKSNIKNVSGTSHELHIKELEKIESFFYSFSLSAGWGGQKMRIDDSMILALAHCSDRLSRIGVCEFQADVDFESLHVKINILYEAILDSELPGNIRIMMLTNLGIIRDSIAELQIYGPEGIQAAIERTKGSMATHLNEVSRLQDAEKTWELLKKYAGIVDAAQKTIWLRDRAQEIAPLLTMITKIQ